MMTTAELKKQQVEALQEFRKQANSTSSDRTALKQKTREMLIKANLLTEAGELVEAYK